MLDLPGTEAGAGDLAGSDPGAGERFSINPRHLALEKPGEPAINPRHCAPLEVGVLAGASAGAPPRDQTLEDAGEPVLPPVGLTGGTGWSPGPFRTGCAGIVFTCGLEESAGDSSGSVGTTGAQPEPERRCPLRFGAGSGR